VVDVLSYHGRVVLDAGTPNGKPRQLLNVSRPAARRWRAEGLLREGIAMTHAAAQFHDRGNSHDCHKAHAQEHRPDHRRHRPGRAYLAELPLQKGYKDHGIKRRAIVFNIDCMYQDPHLECCDFILHNSGMTHSSKLTRTVQQIQPDEVNDLGVQSYMAVSFGEPEYTAKVDRVGTLRLLKAIRLLGLKRNMGFFQASTSEFYGLVQQVPQTQTTPFCPHSPHPVGKLDAYWITVTTSRPGACTPATTSCLTTRAHCAARPSSRESSRAPRHASSSSCGTASNSAISTRCAAGAMRATASR
jgi:hypothetical protein